MYQSLLVSASLFKIELMDNEAHGLVCAAYTEVHLKRHKAPLVSFSELKVLSKPQKRLDSTPYCDVPPRRIATFFKN